MASHHHMSPQAAMHGHPGIPPPPHAVGQPLPVNGGPPLPAQSSGIENYVTQAFLRVWLACGTAAEKVGNNAMALDSFHKVLKYDSENADALRSIASVLRAEDKYDQAVIYIRHLINLNGTDGESWSSLGHCYLMMDELQQAYSAYQSALYNLRDPKEPKLWYGIGILYDRYGSLDHAEEAFSQVMRMSPKFDKANEIYFRLGIIYKQQAKFDQSLECFTYIVHNPPSPLNQTDIWFQIGHVYEQQKMYEKAKQAYMKVLEKDPKHAKVLQQLGWLHHQQSNDYTSQENAIEYLEQSVSSDAQSWYLLGRCYMSQHKFPKAYEAYQQAVYRDGRNPTFWCSIGVLYYQINQYRDALDAYSRAIRLNPNISEVWYDLGTLTTDALDAYERAAELDPQNESIKARLNLLRNGQSNGHPNQSAAPLPQDVPPHQYQPTGASAPVQAAWGAPVPPAHGGQHHASGPAPPPLQQARDWPSRPSALPNGPPPPTASQQGPPPPPPPPPIHHYDQQREPARHAPQPAPRQPSPKTTPYRPHDPYSQNGSRRPLSPSPRSRHSTLDQRGPPSAHPPHAPLPGHTAATPGPRISNPNYGGQHLPSAPPSAQTPVSHNAPPPPPPPPAYSRTGSPPPPIRHHQDSRPRSPRSVYQPQSHYSRHSESAAPTSGSIGPLPPSSSLISAEAAQREREREDRSAPPQKRPREWDSREDLQANSHKKNASDELRARLDEPYAPRRLQSPPRIPSFGDRERDRNSRERIPIGGPTSTITSPKTNSHHEEEMRRADEAYRPSAAAHHPAPLSTVMHQESRDGPDSHRGTTLPSLSSVTAHVPENSAPKREPEPERMEVDDEPRPAQPIPKRPEEPAARKMEVDENYDEDSSDDTKNGQTVSKSGPASGRESRESNRPVEHAPVERNDTSPRTGVVAGA